VGILLQNYKKSRNLQSHDSVNDTSATTKYVMNVSVGCLNLLFATILYAQTFFIQTIWSLSA